MNLPHPSPAQRCWGSGRAEARRQLGTPTTSYSNLHHHLRSSHPPSPAPPLLPSFGLPTHPTRRQLLLAKLLFLSPALSVASTLHPSNAAATYVEEVVKEGEGTRSEPTPSSSGTSAPHTPTRVTATGRIIAIGDLHGDWRKAIESLLAANVIHIDAATQDITWIGKDTVVVQLGDVMDRGDNEIAIVMLLRHLHQQAQKEGGAVYMLNGNHESLNICGDFRYVTPGAFVESGLYGGLEEKDLHDWRLLSQVRQSMYKPGGPMAMELAQNPTVLIVNDTVFAHGGLLPVHVNYGLEKLNQEVSAWMRADLNSDGGKALPPFLAMGGANSVMWNRSLSKELFTTAHDRYNACRALQQALHKVGGSRLIVGHTPQLSGVNCECDGQVWRVDVGMSSGVLNRPVQVLQIDHDRLTGRVNVEILADPALTESPLSSMEDHGLDV